MLEGPKTRYRKRSWMVDVVIVTLEFPPEAGGIGEHAFQVARALSAAGLAVEVVCPRLEVVDQIHLDFDRRQPFVVRRIIPSSGGRSAYLRRLWTVIKSGARGATEVLGGFRPAWCCLQLVCAPTPFNSLRRASAMDRNSACRADRSRILVAFLFNGFQTCVAVSRFTGGLMAACGIHTSRIRVIHNGADSSFFDPALVTERSGPAQGSARPADGRPGLRRERARTWSSALCRTSCLTSPTYSMWLSGPVQIRRSHPLSRTSGSAGTCCSPAR